MKNFFIRFKEPLMFLLFGTLTTVVNLIVYFLFFKGMHYSNAISTIIAWFAALIFSYITSKLFVFERDNNQKLKYTLKEFFSFFSVRVILGFIDLVFMLITVDLLKMDSTLESTIMKIVSNTLVGIFNYFLSKKLIFSHSGKINDIKYIGLLFIVSLVTCGFLFNKGLISGDDGNYQISLMYDLYKSAINNNFTYALNEYMLSNIGYGARLYYPPLFEYSAVIVALLFKNYGLGLIGAIKIVIFLEYFLSGIFMFYFLRHIFKDKNSLVLFGAILYIINPYRTTNIVDRSAYAESMAQTFMPLVFSGLYQICNMEKIEYKPFLIFSVGFSLSFLSHSISAVYLVLFGVVFALFFIKKFWSNLKNKRFILYSISSIILIFSLISFYLLPTLSLLINKGYIVNIKEAMNISVTNVSNLKGLWYKFGLSTFKDYDYGIDKYAILKFCIVFICAILEIIFEIIMSKKNISHKYRLLLSIIFNSIIIATYYINITIVSAVIMYYVLYFIFMYVKIEKEELNRNLYYATITMLILSIILLTCPFVYYIMPSFMQNIQFTNRIYQFFYFILALLIPLIAQKYGAKILTLVAPIALIFIGLSQANSYSLRYVYTIDDTSINDNSDGVGGWQHEYMTEEFYYDYTPSNENSLYYKVKEIFSISENASTYHISPIVYSGSGSIIEDNNQYIVSLAEDSTIQFAKVYYDGYKVKVTKDGNTYYVTADKLDGLVSVNLGSGDYTIELVYTGTNLAKTGKIISVTGVFIVFVLEMFYLVRPINVVEEYEKIKEEKAAN